MTRFIVRCAQRVVAAWIALGLFMAAMVPAQAAPPAAPEGVDMFAAMARGELEVKLIPKNAHEARIVLTNKTKTPLSVRLPDTFAGLPAVHAQFLNQNGGFFGPNGRGNQVGNPNAVMNPNAMNQAVAGPAQRGNDRGNGNGRRGGFFNIPPEKTADFKVPTVCLEHGKKDPHASVPYQIVPIEKVVASPAVRELCRMLADDETDRQAVQAAVWHLANGMSWEELAAKRIEHLNAPAERYFTEAQLRAARQLVEQAQRRVADAGATQTAAAR